MTDTPLCNQCFEEAQDFHKSALVVPLDFARQLERELNAAKAGRCDWKEDEDGYWNTSCNQPMVFEYARPFESGYKFCHHCGKPIHFIKFTFIEEDEEP